MTITSMHIIAKSKDAVYIRLLPELQETIPNGCHCDVCKVNPELAKWDTLLVPINKAGKFSYTTTVHLPDDKVANFQKYLDRKDKKQESDE